MEGTRKSRERGNSGARAKRVLRGSGAREPSFLLPFLALATLIPIENLIWQTGMKRLSLLYSWNPVAFQLQSNLLLVTSSPKRPLFQNTEFLPVKSL